MNATDIFLCDKVIGSCNFFSVQFDINCHSLETWSIYDSEKREIIHKKTLIRFFVLSWKCGAANNS